MNLNCTSPQTDSHARTPQLTFLQAKCPFCRPVSSVKALKANNTDWGHKAKPPPTVKKVLLTQWRQCRSTSVSASHSSSSLRHQSRLQLDRLRSKSVRLVHVTQTLHVNGASRRALHAAVEQKLTCQTLHIQTASATADGMGQCSSHTHTHTHPFNGPFLGLPRWASTRKVNPIWILLKQETVSGSGISWAICKSAPRSIQITTPAPTTQFFTGQIHFRRNQRSRHLPVNLVNHRVIQAKPEN